MGINVGGHGHVRAADVTPLCCRTGPRVQCMDIAYDERKFIEMLMHVGERLQGDCAGGVTKLNKVIFCAEFTHFRRHGRAISGCEFQKLAPGPVPRQMLPVRRSLIEAGDAELREERFLGRPQHRLRPLRAADLAVISEVERSTIDDVVDQLTDLTRGRGQVSALSHEEPGWQLTELGETIPLATALLGFPRVSTPASRQSAADTAERYSLTISRKPCTRFASVSGLPASSQLAMAKNRAPSETDFCAGLWPLR